MQGDIKEIKRKLNTVFEQVADLTEFKTIIATQTTEKTARLTRKINKHEVDIQLIKKNC